MFEQKHVKRLLPADIASFTEFYEFFKAKVESNEFTKGAYPGVLLERFEEMGMMTDPQIFRAFILAAGITVNEQYENYGEQKANFVELVEASVMGTDWLVRIGLTMWAVLTGEDQLTELEALFSGLNSAQRQDLLAVLSYADIFGVTRGDLIAQAFIESIPEAEYVLLDRTHKAVIATFAAQLMDLKRFKKADLKGKEFHFYLYTHAFRVTRNELKAHQKADAVKYLHLNEFEVVTLNSFFSWVFDGQFSEPARERLGVQFVKSYLRELDAYLTDPFIKNTLNLSSDTYTIRQALGASERYSSHVKFSYKTRQLPKYLMMLRGLSLDSTPFMNDNVAELLRDCLTYLGTSITDDERYEASRILEHVVRGNNMPGAIKKDLWMRIEVFRKKEKMSPLYSVYLKTLLDFEIYSIENVDAIVDAKLENFLSDVLLDEIHSDFFFDTLKKIGTAANTVLYNLKVADFKKLSDKIDMTEWVNYYLTTYANYHPKQLPDQMVQVYKFLQIRSNVDETFLQEMKAAIHYGKQKKVTPKEANMFFVDTDEKAIAAINVTESASQPFMDTRSLRFLLFNLQDNKTMRTQQYLFERMRKAITRRGGANLQYFRSLKVIEKSKFLTSVQILLLFRIYGKVMMASDFGEYSVDFLEFLAQTKKRQIKK